MFKVGDDRIARVILNGKTFQGMGRVPGEESGNAVGEPSVAAIGRSLIEIHEGQHLHASALGVRAAALTALLLPMVVDAQTVKAPKGGCGEVTSRSVSRSRPSTESSRVSRCWRTRIVDPLLGQKNDPSFQR
jgi:hypothetical protein